MGCKCANSTENEEEINKNALEDGNAENSQNDFNKNFNKEENLLGYNNNNQENPNQNDLLYNRPPENNIDPNLKYADYPEKIVELINNIRQEPASYAEIIENSIKNIVDDNNKNDSTKNRIIYKQKVKVALNKGIPAFQEAAEYLRSLTPLPPLEFKQEKCIPLPETEEQLNDPTFLKEQARIIRENTKVDVFFKDLIKIPDVSALLMIVDDTLKNPGKKRMALLNKELKYIGVTSKFVGKNFVAYFAFSK